MPLLWFFAIPDYLIKDTIEGFISTMENSGVKVSIEKMRKGFFFIISADTLDIKIGKDHAFKIENISSRINPLYLLKKQLAFSVRGKIGRGVINGSFKLPEGGDIYITNVELDAIPYLASIGIKGDGIISGSINLKKHTSDIIFKVHNCNIKSLTINLPISLSSFNKMQGGLSLRENIITVNSVSLEGEKGYARLKGSVINKGKDKFMDMTLELMPTTTELKTPELMLINKYQVSPGYYVIPIKGPIL